MADGSANMIDVDVEYRSQTAAGIAVWQGEYDTNNKEKWVWLPKSQITDNGDGTYKMPEWLATQKGLI